MFIYLASSRRNEEAAKKLGLILRNIGHEVYVFCDDQEPANKIGNMLWKSSITKTWTQQDALKQDLVKEIYVYDMDALKKADCVLMLLPCGKSAHLEAGYMAGRKSEYKVTIMKVIAYGPMVPGDWDAMYFMFDRVFSIEETDALIHYFAELREEELKGDSLVSKEQPTEDKT